MEPTLTTTKVRKRVSESTEARHSFNSSATTTPCQETENHRRQILFHRPCESQETLPLRQSLFPGTPESISHPSVQRKSSHHGLGKSGFRKP